MIAAMIGPLTTLAFVAVLWLVGVLGVVMLEESGAKIAAALKGRPPHAVQVRVELRLRTITRPHPIRAEPGLRVAA